MTPQTGPGLLLATGEPITKARIWGTPTEYTLDPKRPLFTLGVRDCDVLVAPATPQKVSSFHATLTRIGIGVRIDDQGSKNGTFPVRNPDGVQGAKSDRFEVAAGESFWAANVRILLLDEAQHETLRPVLARCLGLVRYAAIDHATSTIATDGPLALLGPRGLDQRELAETIHATSPHRRNPFLEVTTATTEMDLAAARGATVYVDLSVRARTSGDFRAALVDPANHLRLIVAAADDKALRKALGPIADRLGRIELTPLVERRAEIEGLIADHWRSLKSQRNVLELGEPLHGMAAHRWPRNLTELRAISERLLVYVECGGLCAAAAKIGITHQALNDQFKRVGFVGRA